MSKKRILVTIDEDDWLYLVDRGISRSGLLRQAVSKVKSAEFEYDYREGVVNGKKSD